MTVQCETIIVNVPRAIPRPIINIGSILFISNPPGAEIFLSSINDIPISTNKYTPAVIENISIGDYRFIIKLSGYKDYNGIVIVITDQVTTIDIDMVQESKPESRPEILIIFIIGAMTIGAIIDNQRK